MNAQPAERCPQRTPAERDLFAARRLLADFYGGYGRNGSSLWEFMGCYCRPSVDDGLCTLPDLSAISDAAEALWQEAKRREAFLRPSPPVPNLSAAAMARTQPEDRNCH